MTPEDARRQVSDTMWKLWEAKIAKLQQEKEQLNTEIMRLRRQRDSEREHTGGTIEHHA